VGAASFGSSQTRSIVKPVPSIPEKIRLLKILPRHLWPCVLALVLLASACNRGRGRVLEINYVDAPQVFLRDHVAAVYNKTGTVKNGDRVEVLERERRFVRVHTDKGEEGWLEQRYLVSQLIYDGFQKLATQEKDDPVQALGTARNETNLHVEPGRETEHLYLLELGAKVSLLKRTTVEKTLPGGLPKPATQNQKASQSVAPVMEDWWLIRDPQSRVGWVLARMVDLDVPLDIAQYAEGQRIVAFFVLNQVTDGDKQVPQYLVALTEPKDGMPFDYNQVRVFTWNVRRHRYETAYRERLNGALPITVSQENFDKEGTLPVFVLRVKDDSGNVSERKYKLNTPIVRRVLAPGEQPPKPMARKKRH
jgi:SH3-like domain-containing protein